MKYLFLTLFAVCFLFTATGQPAHAEGISGWFSDTFGGDDQEETDTDRHESSEEEYQDDDDSYEAPEDEDIDGDGDADEESAPITDDSSTRL